MSLFYGSNRIFCAVGGKVPADLRLIELLSSTLRADQVTSTMEVTVAAFAHCPINENIPDDLYCEPKSMT